LKSQPTRLVERVLHSIGQTIREQGQRKAINIIEYNINKKSIREYIACAMNSSGFFFTLNFLMFLRFKDLNQYRT